MPIALSHLHLLVCLTDAFRTSYHPHRNMQIGTTTLTFVVPTKA
jgi:hypothetical protein